MAQAISILKNKILAKWYAFLYAVLLAWQNAKAIAKNIRLPSVLTNIKAEPEIGQVVGVAIAVLIFAILFPIAMSQITSASTSGWNAAVVTIFQILMPVLAVVSVALLFVSVIRRRAK